MWVLQSSGMDRDAEVYRNELRLAELAEPLGYDAIWATEHHFTSYIVCPDVLMFLTYLAGKTKRARLGSGAVILPWHDPIRVAEQISMLDHMSGGRVIFGIGRGLGRVEFEGLGVPMSESRERFIEAAQLVLGALETGHAEYDGKFYRQMRRDLRPKPRSTFVGRTYAASISPESAAIMARLGVGLLINPQKNWDAHGEDLSNYRRIFLEVNSRPAPPPTIVAWVYCHENEDVARERAETYIGAYYRSAMSHYEMAGTHFANIRGYEHYARQSDELAAHGPDAAVQGFLELHVWGTPEQCVEKVRRIYQLTGNDHFNGCFSYSGMPYDLAEASMRLFAKEAMPEIRHLNFAETSIAVSR